MLMRRFNLWSACSLKIEKNLPCTLAWDLAHLLEGEHTAGNVEPEGFAPASRVLFQGWRLRLPWLGECFLAL